MFTARKMGKVFFVNSGSEANDTQVLLLQTRTLKEENTIKLTKCNQLRHFVLKNM